MPAVQQLRSAEWLREQYIDLGHTMAEIGNMTGVEAGTVKYWLRKHEIPSRGVNYKYDVLAIGSRHGHLVILAEGPKERRKKYLCQCDCGNQTLVRSDALRSNNTRSCGCLHEPHGHGRRSGHSPEYEAWGHMVQRCTNPKNKDWRLYGERGIHVCPEWLGKGGFQNFLAHIGPRPNGLTLDRVDTNGNYEPGNVRWATLSEQNKNRRPWTRKKREG